MTPKDPAMTTPSDDTLESTAKAATPGMEWFAHMDELKLKAHPIGSSFINDEIVLALCATGDHVYQVLPYLAAWNPTTALSILSRLQAAETEVERWKSLHADALDKWVWDRGRATTAEALAKTQAETIGELVDALGKLYGALDSCVDLTPNLLAKVRSTLSKARPDTGEQSQ